MKKVVRLSVIMLLVMLMSAVTAFAAPKGYKEVKLTKKNFKKYFEVKKVKRLDSFGDFDGYRITFSSKLLKKGYYVCDVKDFAIKGTVVERWKYKYKGKTYKHSHKWKYNSTYLNTYLGSGSENYNYSYAKVSKLKIKKVKGTIIFAIPSNIRKVEKVYSSTNKNDLMYCKVLVKKPYAGKTYTNYDENANYKADGYYFTDYYTYGKTLLA